MQPQDLVLLALAAAAFWLLIIRPSRQRRQAQESLIAQLTPGRRIMTAAGVFGTVVAVEDDRVRVEIAPGVVIEMVSAAVGKVVYDSEDESEPDAAAAESESGLDPDSVAPDAADEGQERDRG